MPNQPQPPGNPNSEDQRGNAQQGSGTRMKGIQAQRGRGNAGSIGRSMGRPDPDQPRGSGVLGAGQHTNAGSTGTSSGQLSPQPGAPGRAADSSSGRNR